MSVPVRPVADVEASVRAQRRARGQRHRICRPWVPSSKTLLPKSIPSASMRCTCRRCRRDLVQIKFAGAPTPLPGLHSGVCHWSVIHTFVGSPRSPSGIPVVARPVSHSRNFRRSATGGTSPDRSSGGSHARHRPDEGVRQSRPGHPGVGRFGSWFPRRGPDPEDRTSVAAFPRRPDGDTVGGPSAAPHRISRILSGADVESFSPFRRFRAVRPLPSAGDGTRASCRFSCRTARGVSIPARDVHGFLLRPLRTGRGLRFSEVRVAAAQLQGPSAYGVPEGTPSCGIPFACMRCGHRATAGLWPPRHPHPHPPPCGSGVRTELESRPVRGDVQT